MKGCVYHLLDAIPFLSQVAWGRTDSQIGFLTFLVISKVQVSKSLPYKTVLALLSFTPCDDIVGITKVQLHLDFCGCIMTARVIGVFICEMINDFVLISELISD